jgi:hypothetical protein
MLTLTCNVDRRVARDDHVSPNDDHRIERFKILNLTCFKGVKDKYTSIDHVTENVIISCV